MLSIKLTERKRKVEMMFRLQVLCEKVGYLFINLQIIYRWKFSFRKSCTRCVCKNVKVVCQSCECPICILDANYSQILISSKMRETSIYF
ncbi:hypothetical protein MKW98_006947 [Papaver atlanticum]|uniref:Uncharacterized protein n=1 Tax=Papaver atlanticum TaxID=357466 RepID=A0AAD4SUE5_9MAGN|nr:hypothetical protein MKW98_006947 [Papaver atlanticum]